MKITSPNKFPEKKDKWYVFCAGPVQDAPNWQNTVPELDDIVFINPRRDSFDAANFNYKEQVDWETVGLRISDIILFNIPEPEKDIDLSHDYAQTTRTEFGEVLGRGKRVFLSINQNFKGRKYFIEKMKQYGQEDRVYSCLEDAIDAIKNYICSEKPGVFFTSDTHFSSDRALTLSKRPFRNTEEMDWKLIENWNSKVTPGSTVYHLGDFGDTWPIKYLNGIIKLIPGNYELDNLDSLNSLYNCGIELLNKDVIYKDVYCLSHTPTDTRALINWKRSENSNRFFGLFGHIHGRQKIKKFGIDVGVDANNYYPMSIDDVEFFRNAIEKGYYDDDVWC